MMVAIDPFSLINTRHVDAIEFEIHSADAEPQVRVTVVFHGTDDRDYYVPLVRDKEYRQRSGLRGETGYEYRAGSEWIAESEIDGVDLDAFKRVREHLIDICSP